MASSSMAVARCRHKRKEKALAYLGGKCAQCGSIDELEFDHVDPNSKEVTISSGIAQNRSWKKLIIELDKCQLLCRACHVVKTNMDTLGRPQGLWRSNTEEGKEFRRKLRRSWRQKNIVG